MCQKLKARIDSKEGENVRKTIAVDLQHVEHVAMERLNEWTKF
jgi:hypothetical protein